jgi:hypothetical protein
MEHDKLLIYLISSLRNGAFSISHYIALNNELEMMYKEAVVASLKLSRNIR